VLDVGTGSGAIALSLALEHRGSRVSATDISPDALSLATDNARSLGLEVEFVQTDLLEGLRGPFDLVISNPPYVQPDEFAGLESEVRDWEPREALVDAAQTEQIAAGARTLLDRGGHLVLECHALRAGVLAAALEQLGYDAVRVSLDLAGRERVVEAQWNGPWNPQR
jgi:release factor glutamine methyltransferase